MAYQTGTVGPITCNQDNVGNANHFVPVPRLVTSDEQDCGAPRVEDEQDAHLAAHAGTGPEFL